MGCFLTFWCTKEIYQEVGSIMKILPKFSNYSGQPVKFYQEKADGHFMEVIKTDTKVSCHGKKLDITEKVLRIPSLRRNIVDLPHSSHLLCELHCPFIHATSVPTLLNSADERLMMTVFAASQFSGLNLQHERWSYVERRLNEVGLITPATFMFPEPTSIDDETLERMKQTAKGLKLEGYVLKQEHMEGWFKLKPDKFIDVVVISYCRSQNAQFYGGLKSVQVMVRKKDGRGMFLGDVGIGFTPKYRESVDCQSLIGRVMEVKFDELAANGKLKWPRFIRWRDDEKSAADCTEDQFENC